MFKTLLIICIYISVSFSQFNWGENGLPIRQGDHIEWQRTGDISNDGTMIIAWSDTRNSIRDIFVQKIDSNGNYLWQEGGAVVVDYEGRQEDPLLVSDNNGGAYIIWRDYRTENYYGDIYAQHIDSDGNRLWDLDGVPLSNQTGEQSSHNLCIDGNGGAFAVWVDKNGSGTYVGTHLTSEQEGILSPGTGVLVSSQQSGGFSLEYAGNGEAVMVWSEFIDDNNSDLRAQRINSNMESLWNEPGEDIGRVICDSEDIQHKAKVTTFNDGNVVITWRDLRNDPDGDVYAQILDPQGNDILTSNGMAVCDDESQQATPRVKTDGEHAFIYWEDKRNFNDGGFNSQVDPYVQKMDTNGNLLWTTNGVQVVNDTENQDQVRMSVDNSGGAFFVWVDGRGDLDPTWSGSDIYLQHVDSNGNLTFGEAALSIDQDSGPQFDPLIKCNNNGQAFIVWNDRKDGSNIAIEAQMATTEGLNFEDNGQLVWYGVDGNALISSSVSVGEGSYLISWEDNRFLSSGHPGSYTYGLLVEEEMDIESHHDSKPLSLNPYQGPHGGNSSFRAKLARSSDVMLMNFHQYDGPYRQYIQAFDENLNTIGSDTGEPVDLNGDDQRYSDLCVVNNDFYLAYSSLVFSYGIYLSKYDSNGISLWENPINIVEGGFEDCLVKAVIPNSLNDGVIVIYESASFMGVGLNMISISSDGEILSQSSLCDDCENPQFESYAMGDNEVVVTYKTTSNSLGAAVNAQVLSYNGEILGGTNGVVVSDEVNDQRSSDITYSSALDEYFACWNDGRDTFQNDEGDEVADVNIVCSVLTYDASPSVSDEIFVAAISGSQQQDPSVFATHIGTYLIAWEDMRSASGIDQSLNLSFEWDAYFQEINSDGIAIYEEGGIALSTAPFGQVNVEFGLLSEDENLYVAYWEDDRSTGKELLTNIYAQLITPSAEQSCTTFDTNNDTNIDIFDIIQMVNIILENIVASEWEQCASDSNGDGSIDILDVMEAIEFILS